MLITFEGIYYSGKTTQANLLVERLKESRRDVLFLREPGGTPVSEKIRSILLDKRNLDLHSRAELLLFSAARTQLVREVILPALEKRTVVVCDRFYDSTTAYQGYGRGIDLADIRVMNRIATFGITPDRTFLVDVDLDEIGVAPEMADQVFGTLSGGWQRLMLIAGAARLEEPDLLILDEPTNHLDIDSRAALIEAINDFPGATILISHDRHLLDACADRLWLVANRAVTPRSPVSNPVSA